MGELTANETEAEAEAETRPRVEADVNVEVTRCANCGVALLGQYCSDCGQEDREVRRPFWRILSQLLHAIFELDGRVYRSLFFLYTRPGYLSGEYVNGRRTRYTPPLRMFLVLSISFFLMVSIAGSLNNLRTAETAPAALGADGNPSAPLSSNRPIQDFLNAGAEDENLEGLEGLEDLDIDPQQVLEVLRGIDLPFLPAATEERLKTLAIDQLIANYNDMRENPGAFFRDFFSQSLEYVTIFVLLMMPLLALVQWAFYLFKGRYYIEHFVLTLHNHSFLILTAYLLAVTGLFASLLPVLEGFIDWIDFVIVIWAIVYLYLSLKNFYRSGYFYSGLVYVSASLIYSALITAGFTIFLVIAFLLY